MGKLCCIINFAAHYKAEVYTRMEKELDADFYFGDATAAKVKKIDYSLFSKSPTELKYIRLFGNFNYLKSAVSLSFKPYKFYILTGEPFCLSSWMNLILNRLLGKKSYLWSHGWYGNESFLKTLIKKIYFSMSSGVLLYGNYARDLMIKQGFDQKKLHIIYNSLSYSKQLQIRNNLTKNNDILNYFKTELPVVVFVGRLQRQKKLNLLIEALVYSLENNGLPFNICIIGKGNDEQSLNDLIDRSNIRQNVWMYGECYDEYIISKIIYNSDVCVSPGEVGLTAIHSMSYGTPVITHSDFVNQGPEFECIIPGKTGLFFEHNSVQSLSDQINSWLEQHPIKEDSVVQECFKVIDEKFNPDYQMALLHRLIPIN